MPNNNLIHLPGGNGNAVRHAQTVALTPGEMLFFRDAHAVCQRLGIGVHCAECDGDLRGDNTGHESHFTIRCSCREFKGERPE